jgi:hypothetical protein
MCNLVDTKIASEKMQIRIRRSVAVTVTWGEGGIYCLRYCRKANGLRIETP